MKYQNNNYLSEIEKTSQIASKIIKQHLDQITGYENIDKLKNENPKLLVDFMMLGLAYSAMDMNVYSIHAFDLI